MNATRELGGQAAGKALAERKTSRMIVVVPVKESAREQVRVLVAKGPPFDLPSNALDAHHVFLTEGEAIFVFEAADRSGLERLAANVDVWAAAEEWREYVAGGGRRALADEQRLAENAYSWTRSDVPEGVSFAATPGPGDSDGGDVYPP
jgi:hypothetical protein